MKLSNGNKDSLVKKPKPIDIKTLKDNYETMKLRLEV